MPNNYSLPECIDDIDGNALILPSSLVTIESEAFSGLEEAMRIIIPVSVTSIADNAFANSDVFLIVSHDSYAETWAAEHNVSYFVK